MAIANGDPAFAKYITEDFVIPDTTLAEFHWVLLRDFSEQLAKEWSEKLAPYSKPADRELLLAATRFRFRYRKKNLSFFDAVGYVFSQRRRCAFVTGDEAFRELPGVEFLKEETPRRTKAHRKDYFGAFPRLKPFNKKEDRFDFDTEDD